MKFTRPCPIQQPVEWKRYLNERLRAEFIAGADAEWRKRDRTTDDGRGAPVGTAAVSGGRVGGARSDDVRRVVIVEGTSCQVMVMAKIRDLRLSEPLELIELTWYEYDVPVVTARSR